MPQPRCTSGARWPLDLIFSRLQSYRGEAAAFLSVEIRQKRRRRRRRRVAVRSPPPPVPSPAPDRQPAPRPALSSADIRQTMDDHNRSALRCVVCSLDGSAARRVLCGRCDALVAHVTREMRSGADLAQLPNITPPTASYSFTGRQVVSNKYRSVKNTGGRWNRRASQKAVTSKQIRITEPK